MVSMASIEHHMANPDVSIEAHIGQCCQALSSELAGRTPIYLDQRFWVIAREVRAGIRNESGERKLLHYLERLVQQERIFCPISASTFAELMKIGDHARRQATLEMVEELSAGVSLMPEHERTEDELEAIIRRSFASDDTPLPRVWTRLAYTMGAFHVLDDRFPTKTQLAVQKAFFDHIWEQPFAVVAQGLNCGKFEMTCDMGALADKLNEGNRARQAEMVSFESVLSDELRGVAEVAKPILQQIVSRLGNFGPEVQRSEQSSRVAVNLVHAILGGEHRKMLPTIHVHACLNALFRWEYRSKLMNGNDLFDFGHAAAALGYCDAFFTEAGISQSIAHRRICLDKLYNCLVTNDVDSALSFLQSLN